MSDNIRVISIIGKYLEHARIFYFKHATPQLYIASADWMPRNLERRLELMTPIFSDTLKAKLLDILELQISDNQLSFELKNDGEYHKIEPNENAPINNHAIFETYYNKLYNNLKKHADHSDILISKLLNES